jgi:hypothetical protein
MDTATFASALLDKAASHLQAAAQHAEDLADPNTHPDADRHGDSGSDGTSASWSALAGQLRLVAAGLSPTAQTAPITARPFGIHDHLDAALASLEQIAPLDGPPDLQLWAWQVVDLRAAVNTMDDRP